MIITPDIQIALDITAAQAGLVVEGAVEPLEAAIVQLLANPHLRRERGELGRIFVQAQVSCQYFWCKAAQKLPRNCPASDLC